MNKFLAIVAAVSGLVSLQVIADTTLPAVFLHTKGDSYYCPSNFQGAAFTRADITAHHGAQQAFNGCYIPSTKADCSVVCHYQQPEFSLPSVFLHSKGDSYTCPSSTNGVPFSRAVIVANHGAQQSSNSCYIPDSKADCNITCFYR